MPINSRQKGAAGEREIAAKLREYGYDVHRAAQYCGKNGDADIYGLAGIHPEIKRVEKLNIVDAMDQSRRDARDGEIPVVMHRRNHTRWLVTMDLDDWIKLYREWDNGNF